MESRYPDGIEVSGIVEECFSRKRFGIYMRRFALLISFLLTTLPADAELRQVSALNENESGLLTGSNEVDEISGPEITTGEIEGAPVHHCKALRLGWAIIDLCSRFAGRKRTPGWKSEYQQSVVQRFIAGRLDGCHEQLPPQWNYHQ